MPCSRREVLDRIPPSALNSGRRQSSDGADGDAVRWDDDGSRSSGDNGGYGIHVGRHAMPIGPEEVRT